MKKKQHRFFFKGKDEYNNKKLDLALEYFIQSFTMYEHGKTAYFISKIYYEKKDLEKAYENALRAYKLSPKNALIGTYYANILVEKEDIEKAVDVLNSILTRNKNYGPSKKILNYINDNY